MSFDWYNTKFREENPQKYYEHRSKAGKSNIKKHGGWTSYHAKFRKKNPELYHKQRAEAGRKGGRETSRRGGGWAKYNELLKKDNPQRYHERQVMIARLSHYKWRKRNPKEYYEHQSRAAKRAAEVCKLKKVGWFDPTKKVSKMAGRMSAIANRRRKTGLFDPIEKERIRRMAIPLAVASHRKNKTGFFDPTRWIQKLGNESSKKAWREGLPYWFTGVPFDSNGEREVAKWLNSNIGFIPKEGINCHVRLDGGEVDFKLSNIFIEYHPSPYHGSPRIDGMLNDEQYYTKRRKLLDKNGYTNCPLIVIKSLKKLDKLLSNLPS